MSDYYVSLAETFHAIAADIERLAGAGHPDLAVSLNIQPRGGQSDEERRALIDAVGLALLGKAGKPQQMNDHSYHYSAYALRGSVDVSIFGSITPPEEREKDEEIARLRAELDAARRGTAGEPS